jgi:hypothetical protein
MTESGVPKIENGDAAGMTSDNLLLPPTMALATAGDPTSPRLSGYYKDERFGKDDRTRAS